MSQPTLGLSRAILRAGLIVGVMDAIAAMTHALVLRGTTPDRVWKYVASGAFGPSATSGGGEMIVAGLVFHFIVATGWTAFFFVIVGQLRAFAPATARAPTLVGVIYGVAIWLAMNFVVIPMSRIGAPVIRFTLPTVLMVLIHMFVIGVPISLLAYRHYDQGKAHWPPGRAGEPVVSAT